MHCCGFGTGPSTAAAMTAAGLPCDAVAAAPTPVAVAEAIATYKGGSDAARDGLHL